MEVGARRQTSGLSLLLGLIMTTSSHAQTPPSPTTLAQLRNDFRPLLLFAANPEDPSLLAQLHRLKDFGAGLHERDVLVIAVPFRNPSSTETSLTAEDAMAARRRFDIGPDQFVVLLIGKDGGEKMRSTKPLSFEKLRDTIDAMPMRKDEMERHAKP